MHKKRLFFGIKKWMLIFLLSDSLSLSAQNLLTEIELEHTPIKGLQGVSSGDSLFLTFREPISPGSLSYNFRSFWINSQGRKRSVDLSALNEKLMLGFVTRGTVTTFYYFEAQKKLAIIRSLQYDNTDQSKKISEQIIEIPGRILGSFADPELHIICASAEDFNIRVIQIRDMQIVSEKKFSGSTDLVKDKQARIAFIHAGITFRPDEAVAKIKIIRDGQTIFIVKDEPLEDYKEPQPIYSTSVIRLDLASGEKFINTLFETSRGHFSSMLLGHYFYRIVQEEGLRLDVFDLKSGKKVFTKNFPWKAEYPTHLAYSRNGKNNTVRKGLFVRDTSRSGNFIKADSIGTDVILTIGAQLETGTYFPIVPQFGLVAGLIASLSAVLVQELIESPTTQNYFYMRGSPERGFEITDQTGLLSQKVDDYEIGQTEIKTKYKLKGYRYGMNQCFAIYLLDKSKKLQVLKFTN